MPCPTRAGLNTRISGGCAAGSAAQHLAGLEAGRAHVHALLVPARTGDGAHRLDVRIPPTAVPTMRMRHRLAEAGGLPADVAHGSHIRTPRVGTLGANKPHAGDPTTCSGYRAAQVSPKCAPNADRTSEPRGGPGTTVRWTVRCSARRCRRQ